MIKAIFESPRFSFEAYGQTASHAINALKKGLCKHGEEYGIEPDWWKEYEGDIYTIYIKLNECYRDSSIVKV